MVTIKRCGRGLTRCAHNAGVPACQCATQRVAGDCNRLFALANSALTHRTRRSDPMGDSNTRLHLDCAAQRQRQHAHTLFTAVTRHRNARVRRPQRRSCIVSRASANHPACRADSYSCSALVSSTKQFRFWRQISDLLQVQETGPSAASPS